MPDNLPADQRQTPQAQLLPISRIDVGTRLRRLSEGQVTALANSIGTVGLLHPIVVTPDTDGWLVVAGAHRLEACKRLGRTEIAATVVTVDELERQLLECDENLVGAVLTPAERAWFTTRRKQLYEATHPETRHGGDRTASRKLCGLTPTDRFTADTAARTGRSERAVQLDATRGERIDGEVLEEVRGTDLDKGVVLDDLAATPPERQRDRLAELARGREEAKDRPKPKPVPRAPTPAPEPPADAAATEPNKVARPSVEDLVTRARAAKAILDTGRGKGARAARAEQRRCLALAVAELCRPFAEDLLDADPRSAFAWELRKALRDIVDPDLDEEEEDILDPEQEDGEC
jgi:ParB family transcriptional regulator, chromosome partitioning protein